MGRLDGKVALITGAARGTGAEIARCFVEEGAQTVLVDVLDDRGEVTAKDLGDAARYEHVDVTSEADWQAAVDGIAAREGKLDILVNDAAVLHLATIDLTTLEAFERVLRVNTVGPFLGIKACLPMLREAGAHTEGRAGGSIVNIGSIDSVAGVPLTGAYTTSKFALRGLTKVVALENSRWKVRCNIVCPAAGNPEMHTGVVGMDEPRPLVDVPPEARLDRGPAAVAPAVVYFASDESRLCNGVELVLDGGQTAGMAFDLPDSLYGIEAG